MSEVSIPAGQLNSLLSVLADLAPMTPPPTPKGRYVLTKAIGAITRAQEEHAKALKEFLDGAVTKDADGKPIYTETGTAGQVTFTIEPEHQQAYVDIMNAPVVLEGVRQLTHDELGNCPITIQQELVLIGTGMLSDEEPA